MNESVAYLETVYADKSELNLETLSKVYSDRAFLHDKVSKLLGNFFASEIKGKSILVKPNWVKQSQKPTDEYCLRTNENLILETLSYLCGFSPKKIILGDAPIQGCDWTKMLPVSFIDEVNSLSSKYNVLIKIKDFRRTVFSTSKNEISRERVSLKDYVIFDLGKKSFLEPITNDGKNRFRVTCYNPDELAKSHHKGVHKYCIAKDVFDSDIILSMPKIKTHQKAGITNAMKILVGVNGDKDFLPHHRIGAKEYGGDCYPGKSILRSMSEWFIDNANRHIGSVLYKPLCHVSSLLWKLSRPNSAQNLGAGWYGNDTVWRMVMDLNKIVTYGKADGTIANAPIRKVYSLCDGIIAGQGNGPLNPEPLPLGVLAASNDSYWVDIIAGHLLSMQIDRIPNLKAAKDLLDLDSCRLVINGKLSSYDDLKEISVKAKMAPGWVNYDS
jgi:hypothetical protein